MATKTINQFTALSGALATGDELAVWDASDAATRRVTVATLIDAVEANANTFTAAQVFKHSSHDSHIKIDRTAAVDINNIYGITVSYVAPGADYLEIRNSTATQRIAVFHYNGHVGINAVTDAGVLAVNGDIALVDGMAAPSTTSGWAKIYIDSADGDLKIKFGDGTVKTIVVDT
ncbi:MAG TPA: hypothetical protein PL105_04045 [Caldilineaceae bacterium]|nr:hypothetical protein [Caldilineaceae bacterium]